MTESQITSFLNCTNVQAPRNLSIFSATTTAIFSAAITMGNFLVILSVLLDPRKELRTPFNFFVVNLSIADLVVGVVTCPLAVVTHCREAAGLSGDGIKYLRQALHFSNFASVSASVLNLAALCVDRVIAIRFPLRYRFKISLWHHVLSAVGLWVVAFTVSIVYFKIGFLRMSMILAIFIIFVTFLVMISTFLFLYLSIKRRRRNASYDAGRRNVAAVVPLRRINGTRNRLNSNSSATNFYIGETMDDNSSTRNDVVSQDSDAKIDASTDTQTKVEERKISTNEDRLVKHASKQGFVYGMRLSVESAYCEANDRPNRTKRCYVSGEVENKIENVNMESSKITQHATATNLQEMTRSFIKEEFDHDSNCVAYSKPNEGDKELCTVQHNVENVQPISKQSSEARPINDQSTEMQPVAENTADKQLDKDQRNRKGLSREKNMAYNQPIIDQRIEIQPINERSPDHQLNQCQADESPREQCSAEIQSIKDQRIETQPIRDQEIETQPIRDQRIETQPIRDQSAERQPIRKLSSTDSYLSQIEENSELPKDDIFAETAFCQNPDSISQEIRIHTPATPQNRKLEVTLLIMLTLYLICFLPTCVMIVYLNTSHGSCELRHWLRDLQFLLAVGNSAVNPFIYAWRLPAFRKAIRLVLLRQWKNQIQPCKARKHGIKNRKQQDKLV